MSIPTTKNEPVQKQGDSLGRVGDSLADLEPTHANYQDDYKTEKVLKKQFWCTMKLTALVSIKSVICWQLLASGPPHARLVDHGGVAKATHSDIVSLCHLADVSGIVASIEIIYHDDNTHLEKPTLQHSRALLQNTPGFWSILYGTFCDSTDQEVKFQSPNEPKHSSTHCLDKKIKINVCP